MLQQTQDESQLTGCSLTSVTSGMLLVTNSTDMHSAVQDCDVAALELCKISPCT